nr:MAG TPA: hypothetical protein [Caudoviricetes sp.]
MLTKLLTKCILQSVNLCLIIAVIFLWAERK